VPAPRIAYAAGLLHEAVLPSSTVLIRLCLTLLLRSLMSAASKFSATKASTMSLLHDDYDYDKVAKEVKYR